jgi:hypothetical protein
MVYIKKAGMKISADKVKAEKVMYLNIPIRISKTLKKPPNFQEYKFTQFFNI